MATLGLPCPFFVHVRHTYTFWWKKGQKMTTRHLKNAGTNIVVVVVVERFAPFCVLLLSRALCAHSMGILLLVSWKLREVTNFNLKFKSPPPPPPPLANSQVKVP